MARTEHIGARVTEEMYKQYYNAIFKCEGTVWSSDLLRGFISHFISLDEEARCKLLLDLGFEKGVFWIHKDEVKHK